VGKGILLELHGRNAVVMTSQGEFKRVAVPTGAWDVGDEIDYAETRGVAWQRWGLTAAAAVVLLLSPVGYQSWALAQPVSVVTVDINPSLRLTLNKNEQVLSAEGLNADGVTLLQGVDWKRRPLGDVVAKLTAQAVEIGKLNLADEAGAVVVAVASAKQQELPQGQADTIATDARQAIQAEVQHQGKNRAVAPVTNVPVLQGTAQEKATADAQGLSLGQYLVLQEIQRNQPGTAVAPEQMKKLGPSKLLKELQIKPGPLFNQAEQHYGGKGHQGSDNAGGAGSQDNKPGIVKPAESLIPTLKPTDDKAKPADDKAKPADDKAKPGAQDQGKPGQTGKPDDNGKPKDDGKGNQGGNQGGQNHDVKLPAPPVDLPKPPVIKDLLTGNGQKEGDTRPKGSGSRSGGHIDEGDDHNSGRLSREQQQPGGEDQGKQKGNDKGNGAKHP
jgi:hypothetical protein